MGKDLKGKELGVGISQRKDGLYTARFTNKIGKRKQQYFKKLQECRQWLADAQFEDEHGNILQGENPTVDAWFKYWIENIKGQTIKDNTKRNYLDRYERNIKPLIGNMLIRDVRPIHCQNVLVKMSETYSNSIIEYCRVTMSAMFGSALENELINKNPVTKSVRCKTGKPSKETRVLTVEEQRHFLETVKKSSNYNQWALILQTGLRTGEMIGLRWSDIDFRNRILHVRRTMEYRHEFGEWRIGEPKTKTGTRDIPLTQEALRILKNQKKKISGMKVVSVDFSDQVFLCKDGTPTKNSAYDTKLYYYCDKMGMKRFSMHTLRHTFATRCIESGMRPKTLQMILGHANIGITMNLYVHVTDEEKIKEVEHVEQKLKLV